MSNINDKYDYWYFDKLFSQDNLIEIHNIFKNYKIDSIDSPANVTKKVNLTNTAWFNLKSKLNVVEQAVLQINAESFGYNLWPQFDQQMICLNEYDSKVKGEYDWHYDASKNNHSDVKLTVLINASLEPYEGGKFYLFNTQPYYIEKLDTPGNVVMFKSHINHKVEPVTKGKRHSISLWYSGPKFV